MVYKHAYLNLLLLLHSTCLLIMENYGIVFLNFCGNAASEILPWNIKSYPIHVIVPSLSYEGCSLVKLVLELTHRVLK